MNENEYIEAAKKFRADMRKEFEKDAKERNVPDGWLSVKADSTCQNEKCPVYDVAFRVSMSENLDGIYRAVCGRCSTWIQDLVPIFDDGRGERLPVSREDPRAEIVDIKRPDNTESNQGRGR